VKLTTFSFLVWGTTILTGHGLYDYFANGRGLGWQYGLATILWSQIALGLATQARYRQLRAQRRAEQAEAGR
jgi:hypothetical protein